ncbi:MAG: serine/threonine-protein kinase PknK, partial [Deltaproteobacteria bacterium]|nr:serine/threonine-protein kinase PknK [Deltaproteobacteria bacterium]
MEEFVWLAIRVTEILGLIHQRNIMHKDINPSNIIWNPSTDQIKIIDFGIATSLPRENPEIRNPNVLEGTLAYLSPEQTGRMNRAMDYRTDLYSLGVTFYEMLTGCLPFQTDDAMAMIHAHLAKTPKPPAELDSRIPQVVSDIILKLMAKTAEDRYQNAFGLKADLQLCLDQIQATGTIQPFVTGLQDISDRFQIPEKLYGRDDEIAVLLASFDRVSQGAGEMVLVAGYAGIGKSALVQEINKPITARRGYFISGKFDQLKRNIPYAAFIQAFQELIRLLLTESDETLERWKQELLIALGPNGRLMVDIIPDLELIIGPQLGAPEMPPGQSQNRFNLTFQNFLGALAGPDRPLVIFLDDLQWADLPSLKLMELFMTGPGSAHILIIGAYRDNEGNAAHPLWLTVDGSRKAGAGVRTITLAPLALSHVNQLISETLKCGVRQVTPLSELCLNKTQGNPFFLNQFLIALYADGLIQFVSSPSGHLGDGRAWSWQWDVDRIRQTEITDNVVDLMTGKIQKLPDNTQQVLQLAACIGSPFDLEMLTIVREKPAAEIMADLWTALLEGLILPINYAYQFIPETDQQLQISYRFLHDRVQQAAYSLIAEDHKPELHLRVGRLMLAHIPAPEQDEKLFEIVNHMNTGAGLISDQSEREKLAELNLAAGKKAKASGAWEPALRYFLNGLELVGEDAWDRRYDLTLSLHGEAAEVACFSGDLETMEQLAQVVLQKAATLLDQMKIYEIKIMACMAQRKFQDAIQTALTVLRLLGIRFPKKPGKLHVLLALIKTKAVLAGKNIEDLVDLPLMADPHALAALRIMTSISVAAYTAAPMLYPLSVLKRLALSVKYGNSPLACDVYNGYGLFLCGVIGDIDGGYRFGRLAVNLLKRLNVKDREAGICVRDNMFIRHWKEHLRETIEPLQESYQKGRDRGDLLWAGLALNLSMKHAFFAGWELGELDRTMRFYREPLVQLKQEMPLYGYDLLHQAALILMGRGQDPRRTIEEVYDEQIRLQSQANLADTNSLAELNMFKLVISLLFDDWPQAIKSADLMEKYL